MRWSLLIAVFGLSITDAETFAQRAPEDQRLVETRSTLQDAGFFASTGVVRFQLIQGRLCLDAPRHRKGSQSRDEQGVYESITVTAQRGIPSMHYVYQSDAHQMTLSVQQAEAMRIESWSPENSERSVLDQPASGLITWTHTRGDVSNVHRGPTLLHVRHAAPHVFDAHHGLLIERLLRGRSLASLSEATRQTMLDHCKTRSLPSKEQIEECITQLRAPRRAERNAAERQLLTFGTPIIPFVQQCPRASLDEEQRQRLDRILKRLRRPVDDTAATLATMLAADQRYWRCIADQLDPNDRRLANAHLDRLGLAQLESTRLE